MTARRTSAALLVAWLGTAAVEARPSVEPPPPPTVELQERTLLVSALPGVLARSEVKSHLTTGLTTTFLVAVSAVDREGHRAKGGGRIDVRYEPWDEVFLVSVSGVDGKARKETLPSFERLAAWWKGVRLAVVSTDALGAGSSWAVSIHLSVLPFSQSEQREAQRWLAESIGRPVKGDAPGGRTEPLSGALDALLATSIKRQSLVGYDWSLVYPAEHRR
jgi:hypothetical protein